MAGRLANCRVAVRLHCDGRGRGMGNMLLRAGGRALFALFLDRAARKHDERVPGSSWALKKYHARAFQKKNGAWTSLKILKHGAGVDDTMHILCLRSKNIYNRTSISASNTRAGWSVTDQTQNSHPKDLPNPVQMAKLIGTPRIRLISGANMRMP